MICEHIFKSYSLIFCLNRAIGKKKKIREVLIVKKFLILAILVSFIILGTFVWAGPQKRMPTMNMNRIGNRFFLNQPGTYTGIWTLEVFNSAGLNAEQLEKIISLANDTKKSLNDLMTKQDELLKTIQDALIKGKDVTYMESQLHMFSMNRQKLLEEFKDKVLDVLSDTQKNIIKNSLIKRFSQLPMIKSIGKAITSRPLNQLPLKLKKEQAIPSGISKDQFVKFLDRVGNMTPEEYAKNREKILDTLIGIFKTTPGEAGKITVSVVPEAKGKLLEMVKRYQADILMFPLLQDNTLKLLKRRAEFLKSNPS